VADDNGAGGKPRPLEEVLRRPMAGQRQRIDPHAFTLGAERDQITGDHFAQADAARLGFHEQIGDDAEPVG
jgi:hypothetical protein